MFKNSAKLEKSLTAAILAFERRLEAAWVVFQQADYDQTMGAAGVDLAGARQRLLKVYNDPAVLRRFEKWQRSAAGLSPDMKRVLGRWVEELRRTRIPTLALQKKYLDIETLTDRLNQVRKTFITVVADPQGRRQRLLFNQTREILWKHPDRVYRQRVFRARARMGEKLVEQGMRRLIERRNRWARDMARAWGWKDWAQLNYFSFKYRQYGLDEERLFALFARLRCRSNPRLRRVLAAACRHYGWQNLEPWDYDFVLASVAGENPLDPLFPAEYAQATALEALRSLGFAMDDYRLGLDLAPRPGKGDNAACFTIRAPLFDPAAARFTPGDIRIYANLGQGGFEELSTLFHELGHAVHHAETRQYWWLDRNLERPGGTDYTLMEIASTLFEKFIPRRDFLEKYARLAGGRRPSAAEIKRRLARYRRQEADRFLLNWRQILARVEFDRAMYRAEGRDLARVWSRVMEENLLVAPARGIEAWIERPHFVSHPVYYQAYLLAQMGSSQIMVFLEKKFGRLIGNRRVGRYLAGHYFVHGHRYGFRELVERTSGQPFSEKALLAKSGVR